MSAMPTKKPQTCEGLFLTLGKIAFLTLGKIDFLHTVRLVTYIFYVQASSNDVF